MDPELLFGYFLTTLTSMNHRATFAVLHHDDFETLRRSTEFQRGFNAENPERLETPMGGRPQGMFRGTWICTTGWISRGTMIPYPELELQAVTIGRNYNTSPFHRGQPPILEYLPRSPWVSVDYVTMHFEIPKEPEAPIERPTLWEHLEEG